MNREFLLKAHTYKPAKYDVAGWYVSEKLDGSRCFWDGGLTRGFPTQEVPWANVINSKTGAPKKFHLTATGLWSTYGNPIIAPEWFLNQLPSMFLDGELWAGRGQFQECRSIISTDSPGIGWKKIEFPIFSSPTPEQFAVTGLIKNTNMHKMISEDQVLRFLKARVIALGNGFRRVPDNSTFEDELLILRSVFSDGPAYLHQQKKLPMERVEEAIEKELAKVIEQGGEGLVLRDPASMWEPRRLRTVLKYKPFSDAEGTLVGFMAGQGKYLGKIGALVLDYKGKRLELSGMTDIERMFESIKDRVYANKHPGEEMEVEGRVFKLGETITFRYRELSDGGLPKEARYWRKGNIE